MRKTILLYGAALAALIAILKLIEYRFFFRDISLELYIGLVAVLFVIVGLAEMVPVGILITVISAAILRKKEVLPAHPLPSGT